MDIKSTKELREALRTGPYAWPGGYPCYFITSDGEALSFDAVRQEYVQVLRAVKHRLSDGWRVIAVDINWEDSELVCAHTGKPIQSAYA